MGRIIVAERGSGNSSLKLLVSSRLTVAARSDMVCSVWKELFILQLIVCRTQTLANCALLALLARSESRVQSLAVTSNQDLEPVSWWK